MNFIYSLVRDTKGSSSSLEKEVEISVAEMLSNILASTAPNARSFYIVNNKTGITLTASVFYSACNSDSSKSFL